MTTDTEDDPELLQVMEDLQGRANLRGEELREAALERLAWLRAAQKVEGQERPIVEQLRELGVDVEAIAQISNVEGITLSDDVVRLLIEQFRMQHQVWTKECIVRALHKCKGNPLVRAFLLEEAGKQHDNRVLSAILEGIERVSSKEDIPALQHLLSNGPSSRWGIISALAKHKHHESIPLLLPFLEDSNVSNLGDAIDALGRLRAQQAVFKIRALTEHEQSYIRKKARRALKKLT